MENLVEVGFCLDTKMMARELVRFMQKSYNSLRVNQTYEAKVLGPKAAVRALG